NGVRSAPYVTEGQPLSKTTSALLRAMRPRQWTKNIFVFVGIVFDQSLFDPTALLRVLATFGLLCMTASTIYLINDIVDVERDRLHPKKKFRPIASGELPVRVAQIAAVILPLIALGLSLLLTPALTIVLVVYLLLHIAYSFYLKHIAILDIFAIAAGFVLRVVAGTVVISLEAFSPWLYAFMGLLSLFLAVGKRRQELKQLGDNAGAVRASLRQYTIPYLDELLRLCAISSGIMYTLYAVEAETALVPPPYMLLTVPFIYYALFRYMFLIHVEDIGGDPTEALFEDRPLQISIVAYGVVAMLLLYFSGLAVGAMAS
ncbi:MAG: decaprenyl-phosphate phosphoribosyltransferase, partial [Chloroflexota bacterium]